MISRAAAHEGLSSAILDELPVLVEDPPIPGDHATSAVGRGLQGVHTCDPPDRVTEMDRTMESPLQDGEERQGVDARRLTEQPGADGQAEQTMGDRLAEGAGSRRRVINVDGIKISGEAREPDNIGLGDRPSRSLPFIADDQVVE